MNTTIEVEDYTDEQILTFITFMKCFSYDRIDIDTSFHYFRNTIDEDEVIRFCQWGLVLLPHRSLVGSTTSHFHLTSVGRKIMFDYVIAFREL